VNGNVGETDWARQTQRGPHLWLLSRWGLGCAGGALVVSNGRVVGGGLVPGLRSISYAMDYGQAAALLRRSRHFSRKAAT